MFLNRNTGILLFRHFMTHRQAIPHIGKQHFHFFITRSVPDFHMKRLIQVGIFSRIIISEGFLRRIVHLSNA